MSNQRQVSYKPRTGSEDDRPRTNARRANLGTPGDHDAYQKRTINKEVSGEYNLENSRDAEEFENGDARRKGELNHAIFIKLQDVARSNIEIGNYEEGLANYDKCIEHLLKTLSEGPASVMFKDFIIKTVKHLNEVGLKLLQEEKIKESLLLLERCRKMTHPNSFGAFPTLRSLTYNHLGCCYRRLGKLDKALYYLEKAWEFIQGIEGVDTAGITHINLCAVLSQFGDHKKALEHAKMAVSDCAFDLIEATKKSATGDVKADVLKKATMLGIAYHNLATEEEACRNADAALQAYLRAYNLMREHHAPQHDLCRKFEKAYDDAKIRLAKPGFRRAISPGVQMKRYGNSPPTKVTVKRPPSHNTAGKAARVYLQNNTIIIPRAKAAPNQRPKFGQTMMSPNNSSLNQKLFVPGVSRAQKGSDRPLTAHPQSRTQHYQTSGVNETMKHERGTSKTREDEERASHSEAGSEIERLGLDDEDLEKVDMKSNRLAFLQSLNQYNKEQKEEVIPKRNNFLSETAHKRAEQQNVKKQHRSHVSDVDPAQAEQAAVKLQSFLRGHNARQNVVKIAAERPPHVFLVLVAETVKGNLENGPLSKETLYYFLMMYELDSQLIHIHIKNLENKKFHRALVEYQVVNHTTKAAIIEELREACEKLIQHLEIHNEQIIFRDEMNDTGEDDRPEGLYMGQDMQRRDPENVITEITERTDERTDESDAKPMGRGHEDDDGSEQEHRRHSHGTDNGDQVVDEAVVDEIAEEDNKFDEASYDAEGESINKKPSPSKGKKPKPIKAQKKEEDDYDDVDDFEDEQQGGKTDRSQISLYEGRTKDDLHNAAIKIQKNFRGRQARENFDLKKNQKFKVVYSTSKTVDKNIIGARLIEKPEHHDHYDLSCYNFTASKQFKSLQIPKKRVNVKKLTPEELFDMLDVNTKKATVTLKPEQKKGKSKPHETKKGDQSGIKTERPSISLYEGRTRDDLEEAALRIQKNFRGQQAREVFYIKKNQKFKVVYSTSKNVEKNIIGARLIEKPEHHDHYDLHCYNYTNSRQFKTLQVPKKRVNVKKVTPEELFAILDVNVKNTTVQLKAEDKLKQKAAQEKNEDEEFLVSVPLHFGKEKLDSTIHYNKKQDKIVVKHGLEKSHNLKALDIPVKDLDIGNTFSKDYFMNNMDIVLLSRLNYKHGDLIYEKSPARGREPAKAGKDEKKGIQKRDMSPKFDYDYVDDNFDDDFDAEVLEEEVIPKKPQKDRTEPVKKGGKDDMPDLEDKDVQNATLTIQQAYKKKQATQKAKLENQNKSTKAPETKKGSEKLAEVEDEKYKAKGMPDLNDPEVAAAAGKIQKAYRKKMGPQSPMATPQNKQDPKSFQYIPFDDDSLPIEDPSANVINEPRKGVPDLQDPEVQKATATIQKAYLKKKSMSPTKTPMAQTKKKEPEPTFTDDSLPIEEPSVDRSRERKKKKDDDMPDLEDPDVQNATLTIQKAYLKKKTLKAEPTKEKTAPKKEEPAKVEQPKKGENLPNLNDPDVQNATLTIQKAYKNKKATPKQAQEPEKPVVKAQEKPAATAQPEKKKAIRNRDDDLPNLEDPEVQNATLAIQKAYKKKKAPVKETKVQAKKPANDAYEDYDFDEDLPIESPKAKVILKAAPKKTEEKKDDLPNLNDPDVQNATLAIQKAYKTKKSPVKEIKVEEKKKPADDVFEEYEFDEDLPIESPKEKVVPKKIEETKPTTTKTQEFQKPISQPQEKPVTTQPEEKKKSARNDDLPNLDDPDVQNATLTIQKAYKNKKSPANAGSTQETKPKEEQPVIKKEEPVVQEKKATEPSKTKDDELPNLNDPDVQNATLAIQKAYKKKKAPAQEIKIEEKKKPADDVFEEYEFDEDLPIESPKEKVAPKKVEETKPITPKTQESQKPVSQPQEKPVTTQPDEKKKSARNDDLPNLEDPDVQNATLTIQKAYKNKKSPANAGSTQETKPKEEQPVIKKEEPVVQEKKATEPSKTKDGELPNLNDPDVQNATLTIQKAYKNKKAPAQEIKVEEKKKPADDEFEEYVFDEDIPVEAPAEKSVSKSTIKKEEKEDLPDLNDPDVQNATLAIQKAYLNKKKPAASQEAAVPVKEQVQPKEQIQPKEQPVVKEQEKLKEDLPNLEDPDVQNATLVIQKAYKNKKANAETATEQPKPAASAGSEIQVKSQADLTAKKEESKKVKEETPAVQPKSQANVGSETQAKSQADTSAKDSKPKEEPASGQTKPQLNVANDFKVKSVTSLATPRNEDKNQGASVEPVSGQQKPQIAANSEPQVKSQKDVASTKEETKQSALQPTSEKPKSQANVTSETQVKSQAAVMTPRNEEKSQKVSAEPASAQSKSQVAAGSETQLKSQAEVPATPKDSKAKEEPTSSQAKPQLSVANDSQVKSVTSLATPRNEDKTQKSVGESVQAQSKSQVAAGSEAQLKSLKDISPTKEDASKKPTIEAAAEQPKSQTSVVSGVQVKSQAEVPATPKDSKAKEEPTSSQAKPQLSVANDSQVKSVTSLATPRNEDKTQKPVGESVQAQSKSQVAAGSEAQLKSLKDISPTKEDASKKPKIETAAEQPKSQTSVVSGVQAKSQTEVPATPKDSKAKEELTSSPAKLQLSVANDSQVKSVTSLATPLHEDKTQKPTADPTSAQQQKPQVVTSSESQLKSLKEVAPTKEQVTPRANVEPALAQSKSQVAAGSEAQLKSLKDISPTKEDASKKPTIEAAAEQPKSQTSVVSGVQAKSQAEVPATTKDSKAKEELASSQAKPQLSVANDSQVKSVTSLATPRNEDKTQKLTTDPTSAQQHKPQVATSSESQLKSLKEVAPTKEQVTPRANVEPALAQSKSQVAAGSEAQLKSLKDISPTKEDASKKPTTETAAEQPKSQTSVVSGVQAKSQAEVSATPKDSNAREEQVPGQAKSQLSVANDSQMKSVTSLATPRNEDKTQKPTAEPISAQQQKPQVAASSESQLKSLKEVAPTKEQVTPRANVEPALAQSKSQVAAGSEAQLKSLKDISPTKEDASKKPTIEAAAEQPKSQTSVVSGVQAKSQAEVPATPKDSKAKEELTSSQAKLQFNVANDSQVKSVTSLATPLHEDKTQKPTADPTSAQQQKPQVVTSSESQLKSLKEVAPTKEQVTPRANVGPALAQSKSQVAAGGEAQLKSLKDISPTKEDASKKPTTETAAQQPKSQTSVVSGIQVKSQAEVPATPKDSKAKEELASSQAKPQLSVANDSQVKSVTSLATPRNEDKTQKSAVDPFSGQQKSQADLPIGKQDSARKANVEATSGQLKSQASLSAEPQVKVQPDANAKKEESKDQKSNPPDSAKKQQAGSVASLGTATPRGQDKKQGGDDMPNLEDPEVQNATLAIQKAYLDKKNREAKAKESTAKAQPEKPKVEDDPYDIEVSPPNAIEEKKTSKVKEEKAKPKVVEDDPYDIEVSPPNDAIDDEIDDEFDVFDDIIDLNEEIKPKGASSKPK